MRTIQTLIEQGCAVRGVMVQIAGTNRVVEVSHVLDGPEGYRVYLKNNNGPYDPRFLQVVGC
jgi:hypothetical protein